MKTKLSARSKATCCFFVGGLIGSTLHLLITRTIGAPSLWYRSFEYWVSPTYLSFAAAGGVFVAVNIAGILYSAKRGWLVLRPGGARIMAGAVLLVAAHPIIFWGGSKMQFYAASLILGTLALSLVISLELWLLSGFWSSLSSVLILMGLFLAPCISTILRIGDPVEYVYPSTIPLISALCGYWLASAREAGDSRAH